MFNEYPYQNYNDLNLDWILKRIPEIAEAVENWIAGTDIKFADPIDWNYETTYAKSTIVRYDGDTYISKSEVNGIIPANNPDYWLKIGDYNASIAALEESVEALNTWRNTTKYQASDYGIYPNTNVDYAEAFETLLGSGKALILDAGVYHVGRKITVDGSCIVRGQGQDDTIILFTGTEAGFRVNLNDTYDGETAKLKHTALFENVGICKDTTPSGIAIDINGEAVINDRVSISPELHSVRIGSYKVNAILAGFSTDVFLRYCNGCSITDCAFIGSPDPPDSIGNLTSFKSETGIAIRSSQAKLGTEFMISNTKITYFNSCINAEDAEGIMLINSVLQSCQRGVYWVNTAYKRPHLAVTNCHIRANCQCIHIANIEDSIISDNLLYYYSEQLIPNENNYGVFVQWAKPEIITDKPSRCTITGNVIKEYQSGSGVVNTNNPIIAGIGNVNITDNVIKTLNNSPYAVWLQDGSSNCFVSDNLVANAKQVLNQGVNNICPALKTCTLTRSSSIDQQGNNVSYYSPEGITVNGAFKANADIPAGSEVFSLATSHAMYESTNVAVMGYRPGGAATLVALTMSASGHVTVPGGLSSGTVFVVSNLFRFN